MKFAVLLIFSWYFVSRIVAGDNAPVFSSTYTARGTLFIPYAELVEPFIAWYDATNNRSRIDYYGGMVKTFQFPLKFQYGTAMKVAPVTNEVATNVETCLQINGTGDGDVKIQSILPDLTGFQLVGKEIVNGKHCEVWRFSEVINDKVNNYTMYVMWKKNSKNNESVAIPIMFEMKGFNTLFGSHYDHYYLTYSFFSNASPDPSVFDIPDNLTCAAFPSPPGNKHHFVATFNPMREFINTDVKHVDHAWDEFHKYHRSTKDYKSEKEYHLRKYIFHQNFRFIQSKNRANLGYRLSVNHLADRTSDELMYLRGRKSTTSVAENGGESFPYSPEFLMRMKDELPNDIDWRLVGAVTPVKDQSVCGSCWSFGTTGAVEGAYFLKTGHQVRLSQQALIDCSWGFGNDGCDGGEDFQAYRWIKKHGIPSESDYGPYLGQDGYCHIGNMTMTAKITGFVNVSPNNEVALKTALFKHGPISIAIDASHKSLSFYSSGIYFEPKCGNQENQLDHAVLLVGYGKLNGKPYWLVKNSWSNYWGNDGYFLISPKENNCGVMTAPTYVKF